MCEILELQEIFVHFSRCKSLLFHKNNFPCKYTSEITAHVLMGSEKVSKSCYSEVEKKL